MRRRSVGWKFDSMLPMNRVTFSGVSQFFVISMGLAVPSTGL